MECLLALSSDQSSRVVRLMRGIPPQGDAPRSKQPLQQLAQRRVALVPLDQQLLALLRSVAEETGAGFRAVAALVHACGEGRRHMESFAQAALKDAKDLTVDIQPGHVGD